MPPRYDISEVPPQGAYVAKRCPVRAQNDTILPAEPLGVASTAQMRIDQGIAFERSIFDELLDLHPDALEIGSGPEADAATLEAMEAGVPIILGGRLPTDLVGRRVGRPDILVLAPGGGYRAVDVKHHMAIAEREPSPTDFPALVSDLRQPALERATTRPELAGRKATLHGDLLQLAHYRRMLEALDMATDGNWGGVVGAERQLLWCDLDLAVWRTPSVSEKTKLRTTMERYDFEFDFRLDILAVAQRHLVDGTTPLLVVPVKIGECPDCPWWDYCRPQLEAGWGDVSLVPRVGYEEWRAHRNRGVTDRLQLARLDNRTAQVVTSGVDLPEMLSATQQLCEATALVSIESVKARDIVLLAGLGVTTTADLRSLDPITMSYADAGMPSLPAQIDLARAALGPEAVYRRRRVQSASVPRADVEVDVDMENVDEGCYLWGCLVSDRCGTEPSLEYRSSVTWQPLTPAVEAENSLAFWRWLQELRQDVEADGRSFRAYCYNASAENTYLYRMARECGLEDEVSAFATSDRWVDLLKVWNDHFITGGSSGLKSVAPLAGFHWAVENPSGAESMLVHAVATGEGPDAEAARDWLLTYNRGDCEATLALREWMDQIGDTLPSIESVNPFSLSSSPKPSM